MAEFAAAGYPAVNFGPGATSQAHRRDEDVEIAALLRRPPRAGGVRHVIRLSPVLAGLGTYPFVRLEEARARLRAAGVEIIDFGMGEPREETPAFIREALADAITPLAPYPSARRAARAARGDRGLGGAPLRRRRWTRTPRSSRRSAPRRRCSGSRTCSTATSVVGARRPRTRSTSAARCSPASEMLELPLREENGWLPALDGVDWDRASRSCGSTTRTTRRARRRRSRSTRRRRRWRASTGSCWPPTRPTRSCTSATAPASALQVRDRANVAVFNTLSKRSSMPGYRSGFVAGDPEIVAALKKYRPNVGVAPPEFFQRAAIAAWSDEAHVDEVRERYRAKRDALLPALEAMGLRSAGGDATFFLWLEGSDALAARLARGGRRRRARLVLRPGRRGLPAARARPAARGLRARRSVVCVQCRVEPGPVARARQRLDGAGLRVAAEQQAVRAAQLARP